jgi:hypothetical protein
LAKYSASGALIWSTVFGLTTHNEEPTTIAVTPTGSAIYVAGRNTAISAPSPSSFLAKFNSAGTLVRINNAGITGSATLSFNEIVIDNQERVYVAFHQINAISGINLNLLGTPTQSISSSAAFVGGLVSYDSNSTFRFAQLMTFNGRSDAITLDSIGRPVVGSIWVGSGQPDAYNLDIKVRDNITGAAVSVVGTNMMTNTLNRVPAWFKVRRDPVNGNLVIAGVFNGTVDMDFGTGVSNLTATGTNGQRDLFILRYTNNLNFISAQRLGGTSNETFYDLAIVGTQAYILGGTESNNYVVGADTVAQNSLFVAAHNSSTLNAERLIGLRGPLSLFRYSLAAGTNRFAISTSIGDTQTIDMDPGVPELGFTSAVSNRGMFTLFNTCEYRVAAMPNSTACAGTSTSFQFQLAPPSFPISSFQWRKNGNNIIGATSSVHVIPSYSVADTGLYELQMSAGCGTYTPSFRSTFNPIPITQQPKPSFVCENSTHQLTVATSATGVTYQWQRNGVNLTNSAKFQNTTTATLSITGFVAADTGDYRCIISNACNSSGSSSNTVRLSFAGSHNLFTGMYMQLLANDSIGNPDMTGIITTRNALTMAQDRTNTANTAWAFNAASNSRISYSGITMPTSSATISLWFKTAATSGGLISINNTAPPTSPSSWNPLMYLDNGRLRSKMFDGSGAVTLITPNQVNDNQWHHAVLVVQGTTQRLYLDGLLVSTYTGNNVIGISNILTLGAAFTNGWPSGSNQWQFFTGNLDEIRIYNRVLNDAEVAALHQTPIIRSNAISMAPYCVGSSVAFTANAANSTSSVWTRNGLNVAGSNNQLNFNINSITANDDGEYRLMATNNCGTVGGDRLLLLFQPPIITQNPLATFTSCINDSIVLNVTATSPSTLSYQWRRNGVAITNGGRFTGANTATLTINGALQQDSGNYTCDVSHTCNTLISTTTPTRIDPSRQTIPTPLFTFPMNDTSALFAGRAHGTHVNISLDTNRFGTTNAAYRFNGTNSRVSLATGQSITQNNLTISFWFKTNSLNGGLLHFSNTEAPLIPGLYSPSIYLHNGRVRGKFWDGNGANTAISTNQLNNNQWHHVVLTINNNIQRLYIDGILDNTYTGNTASGFLPPRVHMGVAYNAGWPGGSGYTFLDGMMDDVNIYTSLFNDAQVWGLYNAPSIAREIHPTTTLCVGGNPAINTIINSNSPSAFQWFRGSTQLTNFTKFPGANTSNLTISNLMIADTGIYNLRTENNCAIVNSQPIPIQIIPTSFTQNLPAGNQTRFVCQGRSTTLNTTIVGTIQQLQWLRNGIPLSNNANYSGVSTPTLTIDNVTSALNGSYRLRVIACPGDTIFSNTLVVEEGGGNLLQDTSIIAWFKLDGNANNSSLRTLSIATGGTLAGTFDSIGLTNAALAFNGTQNITISNQPIANTDVNVTYSIWFRTTNSGGILGNINPNPNSGYQSLIYVGTDGKLRGKYTTSPGGQSNPGSTQLVNNNAWHHAVLVRNGNTQTMYLNGQVVYTETNPIIITQATIEIGRSYMDINTPLGGANSNMWRNFNGQLDDLRIYRRALAQQEIQDIYNAPRFTSNVTTMSSPTSCEGNSFTIGTNSTLPGALYAWHRNGVRLSNGPNISGANSNSMTIQSISPADSGVYECYLLTAGSCEGGVSPSFTLSPSRKPVFTSQPTNQTNCVGQNVTFSASATATTSIVWTWHRNGIPLNNGGNIFNANTSSMVINPIGVADTGIYYAVAQSLFGCADTSINSHLSVISNTTITQQPQSQTICTGQRVLFRVGLNVTAGATYQWRKNGINIPGAIRDSFVINSATLADSGQFTVQVTSGCGNVLSAIAQLNVQVAPTFTSMVGSPNQTLCPGRTYNIGVLLNVPATSVSIQWTKDGQNIPGANSLNFSIANVTASDSGDYRCNITSTCGSAQSVIARLNVITDVLTITTQLNDSNIACGTGVRTLAVSGSFPNATFTWLRNGSPISGAPNTTTYNVPANSYNNNDVYRLRINGRCDTIFSNPTIMVVRPATQILTQPPASIARCVGQPVSFSISASGHDLTYQWRKNNVDIPGATSPTFSISSFTASDAGIYQAIVNGACGGTTSTTTQLLLSSPISVTNTPTTTNGCTGQSFSFLVTGQLTGATIEWRKNGVPIQGAASTDLNIINAVMSDTGEYSVMVRNSCDSILAVIANLTLTQRPVFVTNLPFSTNICAGENLTLSVSLTGNVTAIQWQKNGVAIPGATSNTYSINGVTSADAGSYQCIATGSGNCGTVNSINSNVSVNAPAAITSQPERVIVCTHPTNSTNITISASGSNLQYQWFRDGVEINNSLFVFGTNTNNLVLPNAVGLNGNYVCRVIGSCNDTVFTQPIPFIVRNSVIFTTQPQSQTVCMNGSLTLSAEVEDSTLASFSWFRDGQFIGSGRTLTVNNVNMSDAGDYQLRAQLCGGSYWSGMARIDVVQSAEIVSQSPTAVGGCLGATVRLFAIPNVTNGTLQWRKNGVNIIGATEDTLVIANATTTDAGNYTCVLTSPCGADSTVPITVIINPLPQPTIVQNGNVLSTQTFNTYQWRRDNVIISGANKQSYTATQAGNYTVIVTQNGCQGASPSLAFTPNTSLNEAKNKVSVNLYPNPTENRLFIELQQISQTTIEIYSSEGKLVWTEQATDTKTSVGLDTWARGVYFVHIKQNGEQLAIERFVKQ